MKIAQQKEGELLILMPNDRLDNESSGAFEAKTQKAIEGGDKNVVVDLSSVPFMSSPGLRVIISCAKLAQSAGGKLVVCGSQESVKRIFDLTGVYQLVSMYGSRADAVESFNNQGAD